MAPEYIRFRSSTKSNQKIRKRKELFLNPLTHPLIAISRSKTTKKIKGNYKRKK